VTHGECGIHRGSTIAQVALAFERVRRKLRSENVTAKAVGKEAMFRRKTDQVYATLQQVQRRLTQQTADDEADAARSRAIAPSSDQRPPAVPPPAFSMPSAASSPTLPAGAQVPPPGVAPSLRRHVLQLSGELATILFLLWLVTLVASFFVGQHFGKRDASPGDPGAGYATGEAGARAPRGETPPPTANPATKSPTGAQSGNHILVLASVARATADDEQRFSNDAKRLNQFAEQNGRSGYKPWFGVYKPSNGGLMLVFGLVNGQFGIDKEPFATFADALDRAGYKGARWQKVGL